MAAVTCELKWLKGLLLSLWVRHPKAMNLYFDSQSDYIQLKILCFMNAPSTLRLIVTTYATPYKMVLYILPTSLLMLNWLIFLLRLQAIVSSCLNFASWAFVIFMFQLEGVCWEYYILYRLIVYKLYLGHCFNFYFFKLLSFLQQK